MRSIGRIAVVAVLLAVAVASWPAVAAAQSPVTVGTGINPRVAVTAGGTGHVVWGIVERATSSAGIGYCRIPAGAATCDHQATLRFAPETGGAKSGGNIKVEIEGESTVRVTAACYSCASGDAQEGLQRWTSTDAGMTFATEQGLGGTPTNAGMGPDGVTVPGGTFVAPADGDQILARPGMPSTALVDAAAGTQFVHTPSIVQVPGSTRLVYAASDLFGIRVATFSGPDFAPATLMDPGRWTTDATLPGAESGIREPRLTSGPSGVWLSYEQKVPLDDHALVRRYNAATGVFGSARALESSAETDGLIDDISSGQDHAGRLHVVWRASLADRLLRYTHSDPAGGSFTPPATVAQGEAFVNPEVAASQAGGALAVWQGRSDSPIRVLHIGAAGGTATGSAAPVAKTRTVSVTASGARISLTLPSGCVKRGGTFKARLSWKKLKQKGNVFVKITRTDFYLGTARAKIDRKAPFAQTLRVSSKAVRGSSISFRARAFIKVKKGRAPKKSIKATIKVCR